MLGKAYTYDSTGVCARWATVPYQEYHMLYAYWVGTGPCFCTGIATC